MTRWREWELLPNRSSRILDTIGIRNVFSLQRHNLVQRNDSRQQLEEYSFSEVHARTLPKKTKGSQLLYLRISEG
jgi:hypothetical protein